jgi:hypothetical protein
VQLPNDNHLIVFWGNNGNITTSIANWIPPNNNFPPPTAARPTRKISKGMQHANEILGKLQVPTDFRDITQPPHSPSDECNNLDVTQTTPPKYLQRNPLPKSFKFDGMLWTTDNNTPLNYKPTADDIALAKMPPKELVLSALINQSPHPSGNPPQPWGNHQP